MIRVEGAEVGGIPPAGGGAGNATVGKSEGDLEEGRRVGEGEEEEYHCG